MGHSNLKLNRSHSRTQAQFQARLEAQRRARQNQRESVDSFPQPEPILPSLFKSSLEPTYNSVDDLVVAGNREFEELDNVDFAKFRNDEELGQKTLAEVTKHITQLHGDRTTPEFKEDLSRVLNARYLQGHGVQVAPHLDADEMRDLRLYFQKETSTYNVADSVRFMNRALAEGEENVSQLQLGAEKYLFSERGVSAETFESHFADLKLEDLEKVRDFSDAWSTSQGGKFLSRSAGKDFNQHRDTMARNMLAAHGYEDLHRLDLDTTLSLLRDIDAEGPRTNATIKTTVNTALSQGVTDYFELNTKANTAILKELGMSEDDLQRLTVKDSALLEAYPDYAPREARAIRTRVLRDLLRVLPGDERQLAKLKLRFEADLINAEEKLSDHFGSRISNLTAESVQIRDMGAMQRANFTSALSKLPEEIRLDVFTGPKEEIKNRLAQHVESQFGIEVHREAGQAPDGNPGAAPFVKDWTVQGLVDLYNAMSGMAKNGRLPETLIGNATIAYVEGSADSDSMAVGPQPIHNDPVGPWNSPGAFAHQSGKSGYYGMCSPDEEGHDTVYFCDDALLGANSDSAESVTIGESTIIHEFGHAIQLGGTPGSDTETRNAEQQQFMAEWSSLSRWSEPDNVLADGWMGSFEYYYDPTVQVGKRQEVATSYGASDPCEDYAEYTPYFFKAPDVALELSAEKFLYMNEFVGGFYEETQIEDLASQQNLTSQELEQARQRMRKKVAASAIEAGLHSA